METLCRRTAVGMKRLLINQPMDQLGFMLSGRRGLPTAWHNANAARLTSWWNKIACLGWSLFCCCCCCPKQNVLMNAKLLPWGNLPKRVTFFSAEAITRLRQEEEVHSRCSTPIGFICFPTAPGPRGACFHSQQNTHRLAPARFRCEDRSKPLQFVSLDVVNYFTRIVLAGRMSLQVQVFVSLSVCLL